MRLKTLLVCGERLTSAAWLSEFFATTSGGNDHADPQRDTPARRLRAVESAERELATIGV